jgi:hypothetical protein
MGEDRFAGKEIELFLLPLHETLALPSGDNNGIGLHRSTRKDGEMEKWSNGVMKEWNFENIKPEDFTLTHHSNTPMIVSIFL